MDMYKDTHTHTNTNPHWENPPTILQSPVDLPDKDRIVKEAQSENVFEANRDFI